MASKTRDRLIDVARQLFVRQGVDNTTMNDIATASDRGRRTLYTYFSNKSDVYNAVLERETEVVEQKLREAIDNEDSYVDKLRALIELRLEMGAANLHGFELWRKLLLSREFKRAWKLRATVSEIMKKMIQEIVKAGIADGVFRADQSYRLPNLLYLTIRGMDWIVMRDEPTTETRERLSKASVDFIMDALVCNPDKNKSNTE